MEFNSTDFQLLFSLTIPPVFNYPTDEFVSFHQSSFDNEVTKEEKKVVPPSCTEEITTDAAERITIAWKSETDLALPLLQTPQEVENTDKVLTEREKRCLVVPIGDLRDKKRKLQRTRSTGSKLIEIPCPPINLQESYSQFRILQTNINIAQPTTALHDSETKRVIDSCILGTVKDPISTISSEPSFHTTKEKECWHLYRKMCDKGVCVSFDTVLRGMLTPTEYRLRQKEISQNV